MKNENAFESPAQDQLIKRRKVKVDELGKQGQRVHRKAERLFKGNLSIVRLMYFILVPFHLLLGVIIASFYEFYSDSGDARFITYTFMSIAVVYLICGVLLKKFPSMMVMLSIIAFIVTTGMTAIFGFFFFFSLWTYCYGLAMIVSLVYAWRKAATYQRKIDRLIMLAKQESSK